MSPELFITNLVGSLTRLLIINPPVEPTFVITSKPDATSTAFTVKSFVAAALFVNLIFSTFSTSGFILAAAP